MDPISKIDVLDVKVTRLEKDMDALPKRFDSIDKRLRQVELLVASGMGALALLQIVIGLIT